ncbi:MAG: hypothetical protein HYX24_06360 [Candidatus Aenigmarchaeota archaeon]|nr:hypothetical protein [Candidatus Aenigmarchaeota archaeon]
MEEPSVYPHYQDRPIIPSHMSQREMDSLRMDLWKVKEILEGGYDCSVSRRKPNIIEKCIRKKGKEIRVVVALIEWENKSFWRLIHVGKTGKH